MFLPALAGGLGIVYNLPGSPDITLNAVVLGDIFTGRLLMWDDPAIKLLNPTVEFPSQAINPVGRSGKSGSTKVLTGFLSTYGNITVSSSPDWYVLTYLIP
jgi:phosphate transport system substrate-binding protein